MILIITEEADHSSSLVIDWLCHYSLKFIRINEKNKLDLFCEGDEIRIRSNETEFYLSDIKGVWYRRGLLDFKFNSVNDKKLNNFRHIEFIKIKEFIYYKLSVLPNINTYFNSDQNKLIASDIARKCDLITPKDLLYNSKKHLNTLSINNIEYATKSISGSTMFYYEKFYSIGYTTKLNNFDNMNDDFFYSLIQNYIKKKYELRIFFLHNKFWSMAIFSQNDHTTNIDFRNYNLKKPNRNIPFELPIEIKLRLIKLMEKLKLNSGSIDMIVTPDNEFVFLEVNPIGQFGMVSNPCNYNLHKEIAMFFKNNHDERNY